MIHLYLIPALFVAVCIVLILLPGVKPAKEVKPIKK